MALAGIVRNTEVEALGRLFNEGDKIYYFNGITPQNVAKGYELILPMLLAGTGANGITEVSLDQANSHDYNHPQVSEVEVPVQYRRAGVKI